MSSDRQMHLNAFLMEAGHHEAPGGCPRAIRAPTSTWATGSAWPRWPSARSSTRCFWPTARRPWAPGRVPPAGPARAADAADRAVAGDEPHRADRHRLDDLQRAVQPGPAARVGRPRQRRPVPAGTSSPRPGPTGGQLRPRGPARPRRPLRPGRRVPRGRQGAVGQLGGRTPSSPTRPRAATPTPTGSTRSSHKGEFFSVAGPLNVERPPQGYPLLVQAGSSEDGKEFAARHAEAIFTAHQTYERAADVLRGHQGPRPGGRPRPRRRDRAARHRAVHRLDRGRGAGPGPAVRRPAGTRVRPAAAGPSGRARAGRLRARRPAARLGAGPAPARRHPEPVRPDHRDGRAGEPDRPAGPVAARRRPRALRRSPARPTRSRTRSSAGSATARPTASTSWPRRCPPACRPSSITCCRSCGGAGLFRDDYEGTTLREHYGLGVPPNQFRVPEAAEAELVDA